MKLALVKISLVFVMVNVIIGSFSLWEVVFKLTNVKLFLLIFHAENQKTVSLFYKLTILYVILTLVKLIVAEFKETFF